MSQIHNMVSMLSDLIETWMVCNGMHILWVGISAWQDKMDQHLLLLQTFIVYKLQNLGPNVFGTGVLQ